MVGSHPVMMGEVTGEEPLKAPQEEGCLESGLVITAQGPILNSGLSQPRD